MKTIITITCAILVIISPPASANPLAWIAGYLLERVVDGIWDAATGVPDIRALDARLRQVELRLDGRLQGPIQDLRNQITPDTSQEEYLTLARSAITSIERLERRVAAVEKDVAGHSGDIARLENRVDGLERNANYGGNRPVSWQPRFSAPAPSHSRCGLRHHRWQPCPAANRAPRHSSCNTHHYPNQFCPALSR